MIVFSSLPLPLCISQFSIWANIRAINFKCSLLRERSNEGVSSRGPCLGTAPAEEGRLEWATWILTLTEVLFPLTTQDIIEGGNLRTPLQELHQMILTPIKAYSSPTTTPEARRREPQAPHPPSLMGPESQSPDCKDSATAAGATATASAGASGGLQPHQLSTCDGELAVTPLPEGDLPGQFTRVMGKGR